MTPEISPTEPPKKKRGRPPGSKTRSPEERAAGRAAPRAERDADPPPEPVTVEATVGMIVVVCGTLSATLDDSFSPFEPGGDPLHPRVAPHVLEAATQMQPWLEKYGGSVAQLTPWVGLIMGLATVLGPGVPATLEIVAGVKAPRIFRQPVRKDAQGVPVYDGDADPAHQGGQVVEMGAPRAG